MTEKLTDSKCGGKTKDAERMEREIREMHSAVQCTYLGIAIDIHWCANVHNCTSAHAHNMQFCAHWCANVCNCKCAMLYNFVLTGVHVCALCMSFSFSVLSSFLR